MGEVNEVDGVDGVDGVDEVDEVDEKKTNRSTFGGMVAENRTVWRYLFLFFMSESKNALSSAISIHNENKSAVHTTIHHCHDNDCSC